MAMLNSDVATGRRMNGAEICIIYSENPFPHPFIRAYSKVLEGRKARFGFKNFSPTSRRFSAHSVCTYVSNLFGSFPGKRLKNNLKSADNYYWRSNLAFICASYLSARSVTHDSISRCNTYWHNFRIPAKSMSSKELHSLSAAGVGAQMRTTRNTGIVSIRALSYTGRAPLRSQSIIEVVDLCTQKPCANRADGD
jgi:hypothetical protein